jgi:hypothetical protein
VSTAKHGPSRISVFFVWVAEYSLKLAIRMSSRDNNETRNSILMWEKEGRITVPLYRCNALIISLSLFHLARCFELGLVLSKCEFQHCQGLWTLPSRVVFRYCYQPKQHAKNCVDFGGKGFFIWRGISCEIQVLLHKSFLKRLFCTVITFGVLG